MQSPVAFMRVDHRNGLFFLSFISTISFLLTFCVKGEEQRVRKTTREESVILKAIKKKEAVHLFIHLHLYIYIYILILLYGFAAKGGKKKEPRRSGLSSVIA